MIADQRQGMEKFARSTGEPRDTARSFSHGDCDGKESSSSDRKSKLTTGIAAIQRANEERRQGESRVENSSLYLVSLNSVEVGQEIHHRSSRGGLISGSCVSLLVSRPSYFTGLSIQ